MPRNNFEQILERMKVKFGLENVGFQLLENRVIHSQAEYILEEKFGEIPEGMQNGVYLFPPSIIDYDEKRDQYLIKAAADSLDRFSRAGAEGNVVKALSKIKSRSLGYDRNILEGGREAGYKIPEISHNLFHIIDRMLVNSSYQLAIDNGFVEELYTTDRESLEESRKFIIKSGGNAVGNLGYNQNMDRETQITGTIMTCGSPGFYAAGMAEYGKKIDEIDMDILSLQKYDRGILDNFGRIRDLMTIRNPPTKELVTSRATDILKLYAELM